MPRLSSVSSRSLTGIGISPPLPPAVAKTFGLLESDGYTAWYIPDDIGSANFDVAQGDIVQGYDDFGYWARTGSDTAVLAATVPSSTPTAFTAIIKCRLASPTLLSDIDIFFRALEVFAQRERINYNTGFGQRNIQYLAANGAGFSFSASAALAGNPHLIITIRIQNSPRVQTLDIYNLNTGTLDLRSTETNYPGITDISTATLMGFALGSTTYPLQFYEGATFNSYLSDTRLNAIYDTAAGIETFYYPLTNSATDPTSEEWRNNYAPSGYSFVPNEGIYANAPITSMRSMFILPGDISNFNDPDIVLWDTSTVTNMYRTFYECGSFDQPISSWNVSNVTDMEIMFAFNYSFNQPLNNWNVSSVTKMGGMFLDATSFNQNLSNWCVSNIPSEPSAFSLGATSWSQPKPVWGTCPEVDTVPTTAMPANQNITDWDTANVSLITTSVNNSSTFFVSQGSSWESRTLPPLIYPSGGQSIRYYNGFVYAVVTPGSPTFFREIYRSTDYQTWDLVSAPGINTNWRIDINETTGRFLATSGSTNALTSSNGTSWTLISSLPAAATNLIFGNKGWNGNTVVAANYGSITDHLYRSTDNGANWSSVANSTTWSSVPENNRRYAQSVANNGSRFIALIGQGNRRMSISTDDGATWTTPEVNTQWDDFANNIFFSRVKNKFVVTNIGSNSNVVSYSTDGAVGNWSTTSTLPANVTFIVESATKVYGANTGGIIVDLTNLI